MHKRWTRRQHTCAHIHEVAHAPFVHSDLQNGIELSTPWPPANFSYQDYIRKPPRAYTQPPYECKPPPTILVDTGRQLFIDNFLIEERTLQRTWHAASVHNMGVLVPDRPWERGGNKRLTARPFGGGVLYDPTDQLVKLWYRCGWRGTSGKTCLAVSRDGLRFQKPDLSRFGLRENIVIETARNEGFEVVYDFLSKPARFVALRMEWMTGGKRTGPYTGYESFNGIRWRRRRGVRMQMADRSTFYLNPLRREPQWSFSLRENLCGAGPSGHIRARRLWEQPHASFMPVGENMSRAASRSYLPFISSYFQCSEWRPGEPVPWFGIDAQDCAYAACDVYNVDGIAYESVLLHGLAILHAPNIGGELKNNTIHLAFSRDGFHLSRPSVRTPFIRLPKQIRNPRGKLVQLSNVQLAQGSPLVLSDVLLFYFGYGGAESDGLQESIYGHYFEATGLAMLRRDGFASLAPHPASSTGQVTTRPLAFGLSSQVPGARNGYRLYVNLQLGGQSSNRTQRQGGGILLVEVLTAEKPTGRPICGFSLRESKPLRGPLDSTLVAVPEWTGSARLDDLVGRRIRLRFTLMDCRLYSFWFSNRRGASSGFLGGGAIGSQRIDDVVEVAKRDAHTS